MSEGLSLTAERPQPTQPAEAECAAGSVVAWDTIDDVAAGGPFPAPGQEPPAGTPERSAPDRPVAEETFYDRVRADTREQWDELRRLVEAVREFDPADRGVAAGERVLRWLRSARRTPFSRAASTGPTVDDVPGIPVPPALPSRWSAVVPHRSSLATHRHTTLLSPPPDDSAPRPRRAHPVLSAGLAAALAATTACGLLVIDTGRQGAAPDTTAAVVAAPAARLSAPPASPIPSSPIPSSPIPSSPAQAAPPSATTPGPAATTPPAPATPRTTAAPAPVRRPTTRPAPTRVSATASSSASTTTKARKSKKRDR